MKIKIKPSAILFDLDGVLIDSLDSWRNALNQALKTFNSEEISKNEFVNNYWGHDLKYTLKQMNLDPNIETFCNEIYGNHLDTINIYPDAKSTLKELDKYVKVLITNTPRNCTQQILKKFDIKHYFSFFLTSDDVEKSKPNPEIIYKACQHLNVSPKKVLLVGDTTSDVMAGKAAGCIVVGINTKTDFTINRLSELTDIVE
jgi:HAD superfamily hydrolase (TIGR01509 family)